MITPEARLMVRTTPHLKKYSPIVTQFLLYLDYTSHLLMKFFGVQISDGIFFPFDVAVPYVHRWTVQRRKAILAKFYRLMEWYKTDYNGPVTMLTLTGYSEVNRFGQKAHSSEGEGVTIEVAYENLIWGWKHLRMALRHYIPDLKWVRVLEFTEMGFPHFHILIFSEISEDTQRKIRELWGRKYAIGSMEHGVDFTIKEPDRDIDSLVNYLMKYLAKGFCSTGSKFGEPDPWTPGELVGYALTWKNQWRLFDSSRNLSKVMAYHLKEKAFPEEFYATYLINQKEQGVSMIWGDADNWELARSREKSLRKQMVETP